MAVISVPAAWIAVGHLPRRCAKHGTAATRWKTQRFFAMAGPDSIEGPFPGCDECDRHPLRIRGRIRGKLTKDRGWVELRNVDEVFAAEIAAALASYQAVPGAPPPARMMQPPPPLPPPLDPVEIAATAVAAEVATPAAPSRAGVEKGDYALERSPTILPGG